MLSSVVLSTFPNPTSPLTNPVGAVIDAPVGIVTVPVNVGLAILAFKLSAEARVVASVFKLVWTSAVAVALVASLVARVAASAFKLVWTSADASALVASLVARVAASVSSCVWIAEVTPST